MFLILKLSSEPIDNLEIHKTGVKITYGQSIDIEDVSGTKWSLIRCLCDGDCWLVNLISDLTLKIQFIISLR